MGLSVDLVFVYKFVVVQTLLLLWNWRTLMLL